jgi:sugar lactone lactonase YvrE
MYHADTREKCVKAFDFDPASGALRNGRDLIALTEEQGLPDGAAIDDAGCYWSAGVTAGRLNRISSEGALIESLDLPVSAPTMPCFGGEDGRTVFVTSLASDRDGKTQGGTLLAFRSEVSGAPLPRFGAIASSARL